MADNTPNLGMVKLATSQMDAPTAVNEAMVILDATVQFHVVDAAPATTPPNNPVMGQNWIVPASATGDWAGKDDHIASYQIGWTFITPQKGWEAHDERRFRRVRWSGRAWVSTQATRVAELTDSTTGSAGSTLADVTASHSQSILNDNFATINAKLNALYDAMITAQQMAADPLTKIVDESLGITEANVDVLA